MDLLKCIEQIKRHKDFNKAGMILAHNGVVRSFSRDGRKISGLRVSVDHARLREILETQKKAAGIVDIIVEIEENKDLTVGDDIMIIVVAGDVREHVIATLEKTLNLIKQTVTRKTEYYI
ncbi:MAG: molybdenum cofactor biosynthesis protein MoaE [Desulfobacterales bacterium]|jgi:molybdopterin synthase catalytic subunit|nr:molybdenum cofactor biosynthesis protein MoaE [Desulfobacterales bacterium]